MIMQYRPRHSLFCCILKARFHSNFSYTGRWLWHKRVEIRTRVWSTHLTLAPCVVTRALTSYSYSSYIRVSSSMQHIHLPISRARSNQSMTPSHFMKIHFSIILPCTLGLPRGLFPSASPPKPCVHFSCLPYLPNAPPISFLLIWSHEWYLISSIEHKAIRT